MDDSILISIIIINYNTCDLTLKCIGSIYNHIGREIKYEIVCFDNNSSDGSGDSIASNFPSVKLIRNQENIGFGRANNYCFGIAKGEYILLLNSDTYLIDDSLIRMLGYLRLHNDIAGLGGRLIYPNGEIQINYGKFPTFVFSNYYSRWITKLVMKIINPQAPFKVDYISGAYFLIRKNILQKVGNFDERFWLYYEEIDLCRRMKLKGYRLFYYPMSTIVHLERRSFTEKQINLKHKYRDIFYKKHYGKLMARFISIFNVK